MEAAVAPSGRILDAGTRSRLLTFTLLATVFDGAELTLLSYFFPDLARNFHVGVPAIVAINTVQGLASLVGGLLFGPIGDRFGRRVTMLCTVFLYGAATLAGAFTHGLAMFTATRVVAGLGIGGEFGAAFAIFNELWKSRGRGLLGALVQNMFVVGIVLTTLVGYLAVHAGVGSATQAWRTAYEVVGLLSLLIWVGILLRMPESPLWQEYAQARRAGRLPAEMRAAGSIATLFRRPLLKTTIVASVVATGIFYLNYSLLLYQPTLLLKVHHVSPGTETNMLLLGYLVLFVGGVTTGTLADRWGRRAASTSMATVVLAGYVLYLVSWRQPDPGSFWAWPLFWAILIINFGNGCIGVLGVWLGELYPTRLRATAENLVYYIGRGVGASVLPLLAIRLVGGSVGSALGWGIVGAALATLFSLLLAETRGREIHALE